MTAAEAATLVGQGPVLPRLRVDRSRLPGPEPPDSASGSYFNQSGDKYVNRASRSRTRPRCRCSRRRSSTRVAPDAVGRRPGGRLRPAGSRRPARHRRPRLRERVDAGQSQQSQLARHGQRRRAADRVQPGPGWALTDYATAIELGLHARGDRERGGRVRAADARVDRRRCLDDDGRARRPPRPRPAAPPRPGAYPLTMVEYAMAPAEPLVDATCAPRAESQQVLSSWLTFLTGPGQAALGPGLRAADARAGGRGRGVDRPGGRVAVDRGVHPRQPRGPGGPRGRGSGGGRRPDRWHRQRVRLGQRSSVAPAAAAAPGAGAAALSASTPDELAGAEELADAAEPTLPPFLGIAAVSEIISPMALLLVVVLTSGAAFLTSGRPAPPALAPGRPGRDVSPPTGWCADFPACGAADADTDPSAGVVTRRPPPHHRRPGPAAARERAVPAA